MRKFLLGTTALATAVAFSSPASAADKIQLELRGYAQFGLAGIVSEPEYFGLDRDGVDTVFGPLTGVSNPSDAFFGNSVVFGSDSEIHFRGKTVLDNGMAISFRAELELEDDSEVDDAADVIDEVYAQLDAGFGRIQIGMQDGAADQMIISAPNVFSQFTISSIDMNPFEMYADPAFNGAGLAGGPFSPSRTRQILGAAGDEGSFLDTSPDFTQDFTKVIYFTPRIYGLQLGVSYAPNPCRNDTGLDVANEETFACGRSDKFGANFWEVAGNFEREFSGFGLGVSASYGQGAEDSLDVTLSERPMEWHVGGELFVNMVGGKLTVGGAYKKTEGIDAENEGFFAAESKHFDAGAKFSIGPWEFGGAYGKGESEYFGFLNDELRLIIGGASYKLGPGIKLGVGVIHGDAKEGAGDFEIDEADGTAVFSELDLRF